MLFDHLHQFQKILFRDAPDADRVVPDAVVLDALQLPVGNVELLVFAFEGHFDLASVFKGKLDFFHRVIDVVVAGDVHVVIVRGTGRSLPHVADFIAFPAVADFDEGLVDGAPVVLRIVRAVQVDPFRDRERETGNLLGFRQRVIGLTGL